MLSSGRYHSTWISSTCFSFSYDSQGIEGTEKKRSEVRHQRSAIRLGKRRGRQEIYRTYMSYRPYIFPASCLPDFHGISSSLPIVFLPSRSRWACWASASG